MCFPCTPVFATALLKMSATTRRRFLQAAGGLAAGSYLGTAFAAEQVARHDLMVNPPRAANRQATVIFGGDILTMEGNTPTYAEAVVIKEDKIVFVGTKRQALNKAGKEARQVDLKGRTLMPGFIDAHMHPLQSASMLMPKFVTPFDWSFPWGDAPAVRGQQAFLERVGSHSMALASPAEPLVVWGYLTPYHGNLDRALLDKVSATRPIVIWSYSAHEFYLNSAALTHFKVPQEKFAGNSQADFSKGFFRESAALEVLLPYILPVIMDPKKIPLGLRRVRESIHLGGVTTVGDMGTGSAGHMKEETGALRTILDNDASGFRMRLVPDVNTLDRLHKDDAKVVVLVKGLEAGNSDRMVFGKQVKLYADGAFFAEAMQLDPPGYADGHQGEWLMEPERLARLIKVWWTAGYDIHIHCNGSKAVSLILDSLEAAKKTHMGIGQRLVLEHFGVSLPAQVDRMKALGVSVSANPYYLYTMADAYAKGNLGPKAASEIVRLGTLMKKGVPFALHTDFTMGPLAPLMLAWIATNRVTALGTEMAPDEKITAYDALKAITINAAYVLRLEALTGSIVAGKKADFVLLAENPLKVDPMRIKDIKIIGTAFEGKPYPLVPSDAAAEGDALKPVPSGGASRPAA